MIFMFIFVIAIGTAMFENLARDAEATRLASQKLQTPYERVLREKLQTSLSR